MLQVALDQCVNKQMQPSVLELRHLIATVFKDVLRQDIGTMISGLGLFIYIKSVASRCKKYIHTVDGRNLAPPGMYETL